MHIYGQLALSYFIWGLLLAYISIVKQERTEAAKQTWSWVGVFRNLNPGNTDSGETWNVLWGGKEKNKSL